MNAYLTKSSLLGTVSLGLLAAAVAMGCGGSTSGQSNAGDGTGNPEQVQITQQSWVTGGCGVTGTFGIFAPQTLQFIAANQSVLNQMNMSLQAIDQFGNQLAVNQTAQQASSSMQSLINSLVANSTAAQQFAQFSNNAVAQRSSVASTSSNELVQSATSQNGFNSTVTDTAMTASQAHQDSHFAAQQATAQNTAAAQNIASANQAAGANQSAFGSNNTTALNDNIASANQAAGNNFFNSLLAGGTSFGGVCGGVCAPIATSFFSPTIAAGANNSFANTNAFNKNIAVAANNFANAANTNQFANTNAANSSFVNNAAAQQSSAQSANAYADQIANATHTAVVNQVHNDVATTTQRALNTTTAVNDIAANSANGLQSASQAAQNTAVSNQNAAQSAASQSSALVYNNLSTFNSSHFLLQVTGNMSQANSQQAFQLFAGTVGGLNGIGVFPFTVPGGCF